MKGILYIIATPIGNAEDITARAKRLLAEADIIAAEDTRNARKLLGILGIKNKTVSNHKFNEKTQVDFLISLLQEGKNVAIISDAGTPCISDPGGIIVKAAVDNNIQVIGICGASAVTAALSISGFCFNSFAFYSFLPRNVNEIKKIISVMLKDSTDIAVFFESPKRIKKSLEIFAHETPNAELCLCNDLTKMFEKIYRGNPKKILDELNANPSAEKGEYTLAVNTAAGKNKEPGMKENTNLSHEAMLVDHIIKNNTSLKDAVNILAQKNKNTISKKDFYAASLKLKKIFAPPDETPDGTNDPDPRNTRDD